MSNLQLGLIVAGVLLVMGVLIFNWWQERRVRRRIAEAFHPPEQTIQDNRERVEPTIRPQADDAAPVATMTTREAPPGAKAAYRPPPAAESTFVPPVDYIEPPAAATDDGPPEMPEAPPVATAAAAPLPRTAQAAATGLQPDPDIEAIVTLQPVRPITTGALAAGLHARFGKPVRWFGHKGDGGVWQLLSKDDPGAFAEVAACMLLADRNGPATSAQLATFTRVVSEIASTLPAAYAAPDANEEAGRAETLDRLCAEIDVQIGLTVVKPEQAAIAGTRLRGVAEAAGFRLAGNGRFEFVHEDTGTVEYSLHNVRSDPFTADSLRVTATPGVVFVLDVPRVQDPMRAFDRMKLAAKRMAQTLHAEIVDDNRRSLDDAAMGAIREQVEASALALKRAHIEPGSARALALFGA